MPTTLYLASQSPRRASLIKLLGIPNVEILPSNVDEEMDPKLNPEQNVRLLAERKAAEVAKQLSSKNGIVVGADTTVFLNGTILNKPTSKDDAKRMLKMLSGQTHTVYTGVAIERIDSEEKRSFVEATDVTFRTLSPDEIDAYVATGAPMDKAGAYGVQEDFGAVFVRHIDGDYYTVVGLPVARLYVTLKDFDNSVFG